MVLTLVQITNYILICIPYFFYNNYTSSIKWLLMLTRKHICEALIQLKLVEGMKFEGILCSMNTDKPILNTDKPIYEQAHLYKLQIYRLTSVI